MKDILTYKDYDIIIQECDFFCGESTAQHL